MSPFHDWELSGGLYPYESGDEREDDRRPCGCGKYGCEVRAEDRSNVLIDNRWVNADCAGLCFYCQRLDVLTVLHRIAGGWLSHEGCGKHDEVRR